MESQGERLKRLRKEQGLSQRELALLAKVSATKLSQVERGEIAMGEDLYRPLASYFEMEVSELI